MNRFAREDMALFEQAPVALWEIDLSGLLPWMDKLRAEGVENLGEYFEEHPGASEECAQQVRLRTANRAALLMAGAASVEEMRGPLDELIGQETLEVFASFAEAVYAGEQRIDVEAVARSITGEEVYVQATMLLPDDPSTWDSVIVGFLDVTQRKRTERILKEIADGVSHTTGEPFLRSMVAAFVQVLGADHAFVGELTHSDEGDHIHTLALFSDGEIREDLTYELRDTPCDDLIRQSLCVHRSGVQALYPKDELLIDMGAEAYAGMPLKDSEGSVIGIIVVLFSEPLVEPELVESALTIFAARAAAEVERIIRERERDALHLRLSHAQKMESVGRIAGGIAHDFNNLLTPILGLAELALERGEGRPELAADLVQIREAAHKGSALTKQLLAFGRQQVLDLQPLDLNQVVDGLTAMLRRVIREDIRIVAELEATGAHIRADRSQLEQLLMNLAVNARDAMPEGGTLRIRTSQREVGGNEEGVEPGSYVALSVSDTGCGMSPEVLSNIFEPFFTTKELDEGSGLGLATVYGIATQHGGIVQVDSTEGRGSTFVVLFPLEVGVVAQAPEVASTEVATGGKGRILLIEDDEAVRSLTARMLRKLGYDPLPMASPREALELPSAELGEADLLLTDVVMPGMSGVEAHRKLRELGLRCPVLYMTGYAPDIVADQRTGSEPVDVLEKPFTAAELAQRVGKALGAAREGS